MNIQEWLTQLVSRPASDPLDWESYFVTMGGATWKALWRDIEDTQAYEDGLEAGLRLLRATQQHRVKLGPRGYESNQVLIYRRILAMLDKADRWDEYLVAWQTILAQSNHCLTLRGRALMDEGPRLEPFVRRTDGGFGIPPLQYGASPPQTIAVHFLHTQLRRKTMIERKAEHVRAGRPVAHRRPSGRDALTAEEIQSRLAPMREPAG